MQARRRRSENPLAHLVERIAATVPSSTQEASQHTMNTMEDFMYQYNRNIREYNQNVRQMSQQFYNLAAVRPHLYSVSFEVSESSPAMTEETLQGHLRFSRYTNGPVDECAISLERFQPGDETCEIIGCGHVFKREAALRWLRRTPVCPVCRHRLGELARNPAPAPVSGSNPGLNDDFLENMMESVFRDLSGIEFEMHL